MILQSIHGFSAGVPTFVATKLIGFDFNVVCCLPRSDENLLTSFLLMTFTKLNSVSIHQTTTTINFKQGSLIYAPSVGLNHNRVLVTTTDLMKVPKKV